MKPEGGEWLVWLLGYSLGEFSESLENQPVERLEHALQILEEPVDQHSTDSERRLEEAGRRCLRAELERRATPKRGTPP